jgi:hypothetical protein
MTLAEREQTGVHRRYAVVPFVLLVAAVAGVVLFSRGLRLLDTVGMLACGVVAGGALAAIAARRRRGS